VVLVLLTRILLGSEFLRVAELSFRSLKCIIIIFERNELTLRAMEKYRRFRRNDNALDMMTAGAKQAFTHLVRRCPKPRYSHGESVKFI